MSKKKHGDVVKLPVKRQRARPGDPDRKLSEVIKEMAQSLLKKPEAIPTRAAIDVTVLLASAAWNEALGDPDLRHRHREMLNQVGWDGKQPWPELVSCDTEQMISNLVEYKRSHFPKDRRFIVGGGLSPEGTVQIHWLGEDNVVKAPFSSLPTKAHGEAVIAKKLVAIAKKQVHGKVVSIRDVIAGRAMAAEQNKTVVSMEGLADLHPAHAAYVFAQNHVSVLSEQITALDAMAPFTKLIAQAEDEYMPSGPPMSPLTPSYFTCWAFFDACIGEAKETIGTCILELGAALGMDTELLRLIGRMQRSRMGLYVHEGNSDGLVTLRDVVTGVACRAIVPAGYMGHVGELWYTRVFPPPTEAIAEHVVFQTPYLVLEPGLREWEAYFRRVLPDAPQQTRLDAYEQHMKYGPTPRYWTDYVFEGYVNHQADAIFLRGLPDVPESRPHSSVNS